MKLDILKDKYVIVEIIPTHSNSKVGEIVQISALKLNGLKLIDRFDYRLQPELITNIDIKKMLDYDSDNFTYVKTSLKLFQEFKKFIEEFPLLIIDNSYTRDYLKELKNPKDSVFKYLNLDFSEDVFTQLLKKYQLEPSNHLVDLLYEGLIYEANSQKN